LVLECQGGVLFRVIVRFSKSRDGSEVVMLRIQCVVLLSVFLTWTASTALAQFTPVRVTGQYDGSAVQLALEISRDACSHPQPCTITQCMPSMPNATLRQNPSPVAAS
jgi:hypothetical protein